MNNRYADFNEKSPNKPLFRELHPKATVPSDATGAVIDFRSSDETVDRYGEIIAVSGWRLETYRKNPVVQNAHKYGSATDTIGKAIITEVRGSELFQRVVFAVEENPIAKVIHSLYKGGFLSAVSVGFLPKKHEKGGENSGYRRKYIEQELLEVSAVSIPANPNALKLGFMEGAIEKADLMEMNQLLKTLCNNDAGIRPHSRDQGPDANGSRLLHLMRDTAALVRGC